MKTKKTSKRLANAASRTMTQWREAKSRGARLTDTVWVGDGLRWSTLVTLAASVLSQYESEQPKKKGK